jgi:hypothetical protein
MSHQQQKNSAPIYNIAGEVCIAIKATDKGDVYFFQNEHDVDALVKELVDEGHIDKKEAMVIRLAKLEPKSCYIIGAYGCGGSCGNGNCIGRWDGNGSTRYFHCVCS